MKLTRYIAARYIGASILIILLSIPAFFVIMRQVMYNSLDESLHIQKEWIKTELHTIPPSHIVSYDRNISIRPSNDRITSETIYNKDIYIKEDDEMVMHRVLEFYTIVNGQQYNVRIQKSLIETEDMLKSVIFIQSGILLLLMLTLFLIDRNLNKKIWKPFYKMLGNLKSYRVDTQEVLDFPQSGISEFIDLNTSLKELSRRNRELYITQKEFTENASHELQTPLAILQSNLDNLWQTLPISEEQAGIISRIQENTARMSRLNNALLLLAKIENNQFQNKEKIKLKDFVDKIVSQYQDILSHTNINRIFTEDQNIEVFADKSLMEILINNLITNAIHHTPSTGMIEIGLQNNALTVSNTAQNGELDKQKLFKRFQKQTNNSRSTGLGLEMCKKICDLYGYVISYNFENGRHNFTVEFK
ncbi:MAG: sensor histidine kinase [Paludibacteraceae bacterium]